MAKLSKVYSNSSGDFNKTLKHILLMCSNVEGNNNKFYSIELQFDEVNSLYRLFSHYGRLTGNVVSNGVYEVRDGYLNERSAVLDIDSIVKKKKLGKNVTKNGVTYREKYLELDIVSSSVGSSNVKNNSVAKKVSNKIQVDAFKSFAPLESKILKMLEDENIHDITSSTTMTYSSNGLQTPLGPLTFAHLNKARSVLDKINGELSSQSGKSISREVKFLNNEYLSLIPRSFGNSIDDANLIATGEKVLYEYDLIQQMETAIKINEVKSDSDESEFNIGFYMQLAPKSIADAIIRQVELTRKRNHSNLDRYKVINVYQVENYKERERFEKYSDLLISNSSNYKSSHKLDFKEVDLFHGSRNSNILSILMNGIYVPPTSAAHVTARMFGNGVYGADSSTKSLNYSMGNWGRGQANKNKSIFCFLMRFSLGRVYETGRSLSSGTPSGYNSIYAPGGYDLINNEYIVPKPEQTTMNYLIEFA